MKYVLVITYFTLGWYDWEVRDIQKIEGFTNRAKCEIAGSQFKAKPHTKTDCIEVLP